MLNAEYCVIKIQSLIYVCDDGDFCLAINVLHRILNKSNTLYEKYTAQIKHKKSTNKSDDLEQFLMFLLRLELTDINRMGNSSHKVTWPS